jgi:diguanylate cyclase (GGDEF)-like protein/PAS domain S-box-containing protein
LPGAGVLNKNDYLDRDLLEVLPIGLAICGMDGQLTYVNPAFAAIIGYSVEEAVKLTYWEVTPKDYEKQELEQLASLEEFRRYGPYEKEYLHKDGHRIPVRLSGVLIKENDQDMIWSSVEDISISKATNELAAKTELLETTFENMADGISLVDADLKVQAYNRRFLDVQRFPPDRFHPGDPFEDFVRFNVERGEYGPGDTDSLVENYVERARLCDPSLFERTSPDGTAIEIRRHPLPDGGFVTLYSDITERKNAEKALQQSEDKFKEFTKIATDWFWEMDHDLRFRYFSPRNKEITGFNPEIYIGKTRREISFGKTDDEHWQRHLADLDAHRSFRDFEYDLETASGDVLTISIGGNPVFDDKGDFQGYLGTGRDVTQRKKFEIALLESEARFRDFAEVSSDWLWEMDSNLCFTYISPRYAEVTGLEKKEVLGKSRTDLSLGDTENEHWDQHLADLAAHRKFRNFEYVLKLLEGRSQDVSISGKPILDEEGVFQGYYGTGRNITERKQAEKHLLESEERFRALYHQSPSGVCLEDYSRVKQRIDLLKEGGVSDFQSYFEEHDDELIDAVMDIILLDANDTLIKMLGAETFEEYKSYEDDFESWKDTNWRKFYISELSSMAAGGITFTDEFQDIKVGGEILEIRCTSRIVLGREDDWSEVITTHEDITARKRAERQLLLQATIDQVTGLPNRSLLFDRLARSIEHARRKKRNVGLIFVDLDHFKQVNDTRGHAAGDELLRQIGERLNNLVRHEDTVARLGGDEFIILLNDIDLPNGPEIVATKIIDTFAPSFDLDGIETFVTASLGVAIYPNDGEEAEILLQHADAAMYKSKRQGRNTFRFFTPGLNDQAEHHSRIVERLRHALDRGDFELHFQPVVDVRDDSVRAIEALIRWDDAILKDVGSGQLISVAEEAGFILPIEKWVLDEACRQVAAWRNEIAPSLILSVNVSRSNFRNPDLIKVVQSALNDSGLPADALTIEITETVLIEDSEQVIQRLNELSDMGVRLALDDFGTGYSSFGYLKRFRVNAVKIDQTFIKDIISNSVDLALVDAIISMSNKLDLAVVAEGVETPEQLALLRSIGCYLIQGFHFSEPLSVVEMTRYLSGDLPRVAEN